MLEGAESLDCPVVMMSAKTGFNKEVFMEEVSELAQ